MLRDYQQRAIEQLYAWFSSHSEGHPCLELPTGSGKSHIVAELCQDALTSWPGTRVLMLTHVKELIRQNANKMLEHWPDAPLGIYSAGLNKRQLGQPITFAGIQSVRKRASEIGHIDLVIVDECHLINHKQEGGYRGLINDLTAINPALRVVGLTATPYRLGHGLITDEPALFSALIQPTTMEELIHKKYLAPLRSKRPDIRMSVEGVRKRGGDYREDDLLKALENFDTMGAVHEAMRRAEHCQSILVFCTGVDHAHEVRDILRELGMSAETVVGSTPKDERDEILQSFKEGKVRAVTNANVLTTGFDHPDLDCIVFLRPTLSVSLYVQMAGRGMRIKSHADHCLVLDFAGLVATHGPITAVDPGRKAGNGDAPIKVCEHCDEINHLAARECIGCGKPFPEPKPKPKKIKLALSDYDIMEARREMSVTHWRWRTQISRTSGNPMLAVTYFRGAFDSGITEYITLGYPGYPGQKAAITLAEFARKAGVDAGPHIDLAEIADAMNAAKPPNFVGYKQDGKFMRITSRSWRAVST
jgi:DNA repair protein RadD